MSVAIVVDDGVFVADGVFIENGMLFVVSIIVVVTWFSNVPCGELFVVIVLIRL